MLISRWLGLTPICSTIDGRALLLLVDVVAVLISEPIVRGAEDEDDDEVFVEAWAMSLRAGPWAEKGVILGSCKNAPGIVEKEGIVGVGVGEAEADVLVEVASSCGPSEPSENGCGGGGRLGETDSRFCSISCPT